MPPDASSLPEMGLNCIATSTLVYGPGGATITLYSFRVARCTSTFLPLGAEGISSTAHCPSAMLQPSIPFASKSNFSSGTLSGTLISAAAADGGRRVTPYAPSAANTALNQARRDVPVISRSSLVPLDRPDDPGRDAPGAHRSRARVPHRRAGRPRSPLPL